MRILPCRAVTQLQMVAGPNLSWVRNAALNINRLHTEKTLPWAEAGNLRAGGQLDHGSW